MAFESMQEKAKALFEYLKELCQLNQQKVLDVQKQQGFVFLRRIENPKYVEIITRDSGTEEANEGGILIKFQKPDFTPCPSPDQELLSWLMPGWNDYRREASHYALPQQIDHVFQPAVCRLFRTLGYGAFPIAAKPQQAPQVAPTYEVCISAHF